MKRSAAADGPDAKNVSAVARAFTIVEQLARVPSSNLEDLSKAVALAKPTVYRFLLTLRELGYVKKDGAERWFLTMKLFSVGSKALDHIDLTQLARPVAERLSAELGETVHLGVLDEDEALYVLKIESKFTIRMYSRVGKKIPLYCTAIGKILLADFPPEDKRAYLLGHPLLPLTPHTLRTAAALEAELEKVRAEGLAVDAEEREVGIACLAAPIRDHSGRAVAALSVSWPKFRFDAGRRAEYAAAIKAAAEEISTVLGAAEV
jgi:IclR family KDG regulon transcriptional repressor